MARDPRQDILHPPDQTQALGRVWPRTERGAAGLPSSKLRASGSEGLSAMEGRVEKYVCACTGLVGKPPEWAVVSEVSGAGPGEGVAQSGGRI